MITSDRNVFVAAHVTQPVKDTLRRIAKKRGRSMSELVSEAVEEKLQREIGQDIMKGENPTQVIVDDIAFSKEAFQLVTAGLKPMEPIEFTGYWEPNESK